jgi:hypothetical protein
VALALSTAYIHLMLGGLLFALTAFGYGAFAVALLAPIALAGRFRWLIRLSLAAYTLSVIVGWLLDGPRYDVAYITKAIEIALIALLAVDFARRDGTPIGRIRREIRSLLARPRGTASGRA